MIFNTSAGGYLNANDMKGYDQSLQYCMPTIREDTIIPRMASSALTTQTMDLQVVSDRNLELTNNIR